MTNRVMQAKYRKIRAGKRKAYLNKPKTVGPAVGWLDWIHGRARELSAFEHWFWDIPMGDTTAQMQTEMRAKHGLPIMVVATSKDDVEKKRKLLEKELDIKAYNYVSLNEVAGVKYCMLWSANKYFIIMKVGINDKVIWRSIQYNNRHTAMEAHRRKKVLWKETINLDPT